MLRVNLVTVKKRKPIQIPFAAIFVVLGLILIGVGWVVGQSILASQKEELEKEKEDLQREVGSKKTQFQDKEKKEGQLSSIEDEIKTIKSLSGTDIVRWYEVFADLTRLIPEKSVWLTNFRVDSDNRIQMSAVAADKEEGDDKGITKGIRLLYKNLQDHPRYDEVFLSQATEGRLENAPIMRFEISCKINKAQKGGGAKADE